MADHSNTPGDGATRGTLRIREMPVAERPRERLTRLGPSALGTVELLAIVIGSGSGGRSSLELAQEVFSRAAGSLRRMGTSPVAALRAVPGLGPTRAVVIHAALELGRRLAAETRDSGVPINGPVDVYRFFAPGWRTSPSRSSTWRSWIPSTGSSGT